MFQQIGLLITLFRLILFTSDSAHYHTTKMCVIAVSSSTVTACPRTSVKQNASQFLISNRTDHLACLCFGFTFSHSNKCLYKNPTV